MVELKTTEFLKSKNNLPIVTFVVL